MAESFAKVEKTGWSWVVVLGGDKRVFLRKNSEEGARISANFINAVYNERVKPLVDGLEKLRDCNWTISLPDRMDAVRAIARESLEDFRG